ncbi:MAG: hypothetical protein JWQ35_263 [Bacteriovoracaceae bacterium]|nr:hypothetical protein [Bacteriovoracaceae bacterium]
MSLKQSALLIFIAACGFLLVANQDASASNPGDKIEKCIHILARLYEADTEQRTKFFGPDLTAKALEKIFPRLISEDSNMSWSEFNARLLQMHKDLLLKAHDRALAALLVPGVFHLRPSPEFLVQYGYSRRVPIHETTINFASIVSSLVNHFRQRQGAAGSVVASMQYRREFQAYSAFLNYLKALFHFRPLNETKVVSQMIDPTAMYFAAVEDLNFDQIKFDNSWREFKAGIKIDGLTVLNIVEDSLALSITLEVSMERAHYRIFLAFLDHWRIISRLASFRDQVNFATVLILEDEGKESKKIQSEVLLAMIESLKQPTVPGSVTIDLSSAIALYRDHIFATLFRDGK